MFPRSVLVLITCLVAGCVTSGPMESPKATAMAPAQTAATAPVAAKAAVPAKPAAPAAVAKPARSACAHIKPGSIIKSRPYSQGRYITNLYVTYYRVERISSPSNFIATDIKTVNVNTGETKGRHYGKGVTRNCRDFD